MQSQTTIPLMFFLCRTTCEDRLPQETQVTSLLLHLYLHAAFFLGPTTGRELGIAWRASIGGTAFHAACLQSWKESHRGQREFMKDQLVLLKYILKVLLKQQKCLCSHKSYRVIEGWSRWQESCLLHLNVRFCCESINLNTKTEVQLVSGNFVNDQLWNSPENHKALLNSQQTFIWFTKELRIIFRRAKL